MRPLQSLLLLLATFAAGLILGGLGIWLVGTQTNLLNLQNDLVSPFQQNQVTSGINNPLQRYSFPALSEADKDFFRPSQIVITEMQQTTETTITGLFSYQSQGKTITGQIRMPKTQPADPKIIIMARGFVPENIYLPGVGTSRAAAVYAENGYITLAPDFLGFGKSDAAPSDNWENRFIKPVSILDLYYSLTTNGITQEKSLGELYQVAPTENIAFWGHSNGGQIMLSVLAILQKPIPTTLWAPVTAPFPYSILYFGDEEADEGKGQRAMIRDFEKTYDVFDFSLTQHLDKLTGPMQIHQGTNDDAVLQWWSQEFVDKLAAENKRRDAVRKAQTLTSTASAEATPTQTELLPNIEYQLFNYPGNDHNMQPNWDTVVQRDLAFFGEYL